MSQQPVTVIPPFWVHNRAIVRQKSPEAEFVIRRIIYSNTPESTFVMLVPFEVCMDEDFKTRRERIEATTVRVPLPKFTDAYEKTGRIMSVMRAPM